MELLFTEPEKLLLLFVYVWLIGLYTKAKARLGSKITENSLIVQSFLYSSATPFRAWLFGYEKQYAALECLIIMGEENLSTKMYLSVIKWLRISLATLFYAMLMFLI